MRKTALFLAAILLALSCCTALASTAPDAFSYEGTYIPFAAHNFQIYLPNDWVVYETVDGSFVVNDAENARILHIMIFENADAYTLETLLADYRADGDYAAVSPVYHAGIPFVSFVNPADDTYGSITISGDDAFLYFFLFSPYSDEAFHDLSAEIMSSLTSLK